MGRLNYIFLFFLSFHLVTLSQNKISGKVLDEKKEPLAFANIIVRDSTGGILKFTNSDDLGKYEFRNIPNGNFKLEYSLMSYKTFIKDVLLNGNNQNIDVSLEEDITSLDEVILNVDKPIKIKKDTIVFNVNSFKTGEEQVVEDILRKIPGLEVTDEGEIKVNGREVEKVMVEGDDFFEKGYKILTKNMPSNPINKVEVYQKYSENKLLKGIEESEKVAINLTLNDKVKREWFGNIELGKDVFLNDYYNLRSNLMNFGKKNKYYFLSNINNISFDATGDISHLIKSSNYGEPASIGDGQFSYKLIDINLLPPNFKKSRTSLKKTELLSLNNIIKLTDKSKLKIIGLINNEENDFFKSSIYDFNVDNNQFVNTENYALNKGKLTGFGRVDLDFDFSKSASLKVITKYNKSVEDTKSKLNFNEENLIENLETKQDFFDLKISLTKRFNKNRLFLITGRYIDEKMPQNYSVNRFLFQDLFQGQLNVNNVAQNSQNKFSYRGVEVHLFEKKNDKNLIEIKLGAQYRRDELLSIFQLKNGDNVENTPVNYLNNLVYSNFDLYSGIKYRYKLKKITIQSELETHLLINKMESNSINNEQLFYINPKVGLEWEINNKNKIVTTYSYNTTNAKILDVYGNYSLVGYNSFSKGLSEFNQFNNTSVVLNYKLGDWSDKFFLNAYLFYNNNHNFLTTNSFVEQEYSLSEKIQVTGREVSSVVVNVDRYIRHILSTLKFKLQVSNANYKSVFNNTDIREINSLNYIYGLELRSGFKGIFNYHLGSKWEVNRLETFVNNSYINNITFLDLSLLFNKNLNFQLQSERYYFGNIDKENSLYYFLDASFRYTHKENKLFFSLIGKNLFNTKSFNYFSVSDINTSKTEYRLLPRYLMLSVNFRF